MVYRACTEDYEYILKHVVNYDLVSKTDKFSEASHETVSAVLVEAGRMCEEKLSPLQRIGCLLYTSPSPRDATLSRMPSSA